MLHKKKIVAVSGFLIVLFSVTGVASAQMMGYAYPASSPASASATLTAAQLHGQSVYKALQEKQISCGGISADDYETLGEYYMGAMAGSSFQSMDDAMDRMMGQNISQAMYAAMGKRFSGCDPNAALPSNIQSGMMQGIWSFPWNINYGYMPMMNDGYGYGGWGIFGFLWMILWWAMIAIGVVALARWLGHVRHHGWPGGNRSAIDILKERYAKGEIEKKEFEEKKKDIESK